MKKLYLFLILSFFISCTGYKVIKVPNSGKYQNIYRMSGNFLPISKDHVGPYGNFQISGEVRYNNEYDRQEYGLVVGGLIQNGLYIKEGQSLILNIDGENFEYLRREKPYKAEQVEMHRQKYILELAWFDTDLEIFNKIGKANIIEYIVYGKEKIMKGKFGKKNIENFNSFNSEYILEHNE